MIAFRSPEIVLPATALLIAVLIGCSPAVPVTVPENYHGHVTILCDRLERVATPIYVGSTGEVPSALCPSSQTSLTVVRNGQPVKPANEPKWGITGDGIVLSVEFDVP